MSTTPQVLLLARRALVQFPRNPVLPGFSVMPVLMMYVVFGGLFAGVSELPGFLSDNYFEYLAPTAVLLATVPGIGNAGVALAADFQSGYFHKLLTTPTSVGTLITRPPARRLPTAYGAGRPRAAARRRPRRAR